MTNIKRKIIDNLDQISKLQKEIKSDIASLSQQKRNSEELNRSIEAAKNSNAALVGGGWLLFFLEIRSKIDREKMMIKIGEHSYDLEDLKDLAEVARERLQIIRDAEVQGVKLSEDSLKMMKEDKISFLLEEKKEEIFIRDKNENFEKFSKKMKEKLKELRERQSERNHKKLTETT